MRRLPGLDGSSAGIVLTLWCMIKNWLLPEGHAPNPRQQALSISPAEVNATGFFLPVFPGLCRVQD